MTELYRVVHSASGAAVTHKELEELALTEKWAKGLVYCDIDGFAVMADGVLVLLDECGSYAFPPDGLFRVEWFR